VSLQLMSEKLTESLGLCDTARLNNARTQVQ